MWVVGDREDIKRTGQLKSSGRDNGGGVPKEVCIWPLETGTGDPG